VITRAGKGRERKTPCHGGKKKEYERGKEAALLVTSNWEGKKRGECEPLKREKGGDLAVPVRSSASGSEEGGRKKGKKRDIPLPISYSIGEEDGEGGEEGKGNGQLQLDRITRKEKGEVDQHVIS